MPLIVLMAVCASAAEHALLALEAPVAVTIPYSYDGFNGERMNARRTALDWAVVAGLAPGVTRRSGIAGWVRFAARRTRWTGAAWDEPFATNSTQLGGDLMWWRWLRTSFPASYLNVGGGPIAMFAPLVVVGAHTEATLGWAMDLGERHPDYQVFFQGTVGATLFAMGPFTEFDAGPTLHWSPEQVGAFISVGLMLPRR